MFKGVHYVIYHKRLFFQTLFLFFSYPLSIQCRHLIPALNSWQPGHKTQPYAQMSPGSPGMDDLTTERSIDLQATRVIDVFAYV